MVCFLYFSKRLPVFRRLLKDFPLLDFVLNRSMVLSPGGWLFCAGWYLLMGFSTYATASAAPALNYYSLVVTTIAWNIAFFCLIAFWVLCRRLYKNEKSTLDGSIVWILAKQWVRVLELHEKGSDRHEPMPFVHVYGAKAVCYCKKCVQKQIRSFKRQLYCKCG
jgi:hypothetical protein